MAVWRPWGTDEVSIHAPVKGRHAISRGDGKHIVVSIHAPVKGRRAGEER